MPTYQYACTECDERLEAVQSFTDDPLTECPVCGGRLRKVFSAVGVVFKGSGFYKTDSRSSNGSRAGGDGAKDGAKDGGKDGGGKDVAAKDGASKDGGSKDGGSKDGAGKVSTSVKADSNGSSGGSTGSKGSGPKAPASTPAAKSA